MGKRSSFDRVANDFYPTPFKAVPSLIPWLKRERIRTFAEPCAGDGALVQHLESFGLVCRYSGDISTGQDALAIEDFGVPAITNPPWSRDALHRLIAHFMCAAPFAWLLFDADWAHTKQSRNLVRQCSHILPVGRFKWIAGSRFTGKDNAAWYRFEQAHTGGPIQLPFRGSDTVRSARPCRQCGTPYRPTRADARFCSPACKQRAWRERLSVTEPSQPEGRR